MKTFALPGNDDSLSREQLSRTTEGRFYLRSYLLIRLCVGVLGLLLPVVLVAGDALLRDGPTVARESLSAYYHSGMRDVFVGVLCVIGFFLVTYMVGRRNRENLLSSIAGVAAVGVALLPTKGPTGSVTPLQTAFGEAVVNLLHFVCAITFILVLAGLSLCFGKKERSRGNPRHRAVHVTCATVMFVALTGLTGLSLAGRDRVAGWSVLLVIEVVCTVAFGFSWLLKGAELWQWLVRLGVYGSEEQRRAAAGGVPVSAPAPARGPDAPPALG